MEQTDAERRSDQAPRPAGSALYQAALSVIRRRRWSRRNSARHAGELRALYERNRTLIDSLPDE